MDSLQAIFMSDHKGKCGYCEEFKPLDEMVRDSLGRGHYHCIDCETEVQKDFYSGLLINLGQEFNEVKSLWHLSKKHKIERLLRWAFG
jgi:tRNA(Ile2) C34 agmatinyltransferase TiaS